MGGATPKTFEGERARELGRKGGLRRAELERLRREEPEKYLRARFDAEQAGLTDLLLDAAYGRKSFLQEVDVECESCGSHMTVEQPILPPDKRLAAITKALEFAAGRPGMQKPEPPKQDEKPKPGLVVE